MLEKINLLPRIEAVWEKRVKIRRLVQTGSIVILLVYFLLLSSLFSYLLILGKEIDSVEAKINQQENQIKAFQAREAKQLLLKSKLKNLAKILEKKGNPEQILQDLINLSLPEISFLNISYQDNVLTIEGEAQDALILDALVKNLENQGSQVFREIKFEEVSKKEDGFYTFELFLAK